LTAFRSASFQYLLLALHALAAHRTPQLPPTTASVQHLAHLLQDYAHSLDPATELGYWRKRPWHRCPPLPKGKPELPAPADDSALPVPAAGVARTGQDKTLHFDFAAESPGPQDGPMHAGFTPFSMASFEGEHLMLRWTYCASRFGPGEFEAFVRMNAEKLEALIGELAG
jgi:hypothetical protein